MPIRRAGLLARLTLPSALDALAETAAWLDAHGCTPVVEQQSASAAHLDGRWPMAPRSAVATGVDVVLAFGGDGTLLDAAGIVADANLDVPVLGVNLGHLGFLTEVSRGELVGALTALLAERTRIDSRLMLAGRVERNGRTAASRVALNDVVVTRGAVSRMIETDVSVDGQFVCHVKADGVILATATGSTAYNLSAGGPIVHPSVDAFVLTPIAPHTLTNRPLVLPASVTVTLRPAVDVDTDIIATFDGHHSVPLTGDDVVVITRAARPLRLLRVADRTHFDVLREKLKWGD
jgi:NAD+ kinase